MTLHTMTQLTTFTKNFCACQSSSFTDIRLICSVFVEFITSFFHVLTCFNGCVAAMDARLGSRLRWFCDRFGHVACSRTFIVGGKQAALTQYKGERVKVEKQF